MARRVKSFLFLALLLSCKCLHGQTADVIRFKFIVNELTGHELALEEFLEKDVTQSLSGNCKSSWGFFYFRVSSLGKVDSIYYEGTLENIVSKKIKENITKTTGHWITSEGKNKQKKYWFVYPYFDFGGTYYKTSNCSEAEKVLQKNLIEIAENLGKVGLFIKRNGSTVISSAKKGGPYIEL